MPDAFDPYFKWLGIPKSDQPPHAYRLLGIELFESDADVISNAADGRMAQIKNYQTGKFGAVSQKLLNEIAAAKVCLLRPEKKAEYDQRLRAYLQKRDAAAVQVKEQVIAQAVAAPAESDEGLSFLDHASVPTRATAHAPVRKKKSGWLVPAVVGVGSLALVSGAVAYVVFTGVGKDNPPNSQTAQLGESGRGAKGSAAKSSENSPAAASGVSLKSTGRAPAARDSGHPSAPRPTAASPSTLEPNKGPKPKSDLVPEPDTTSPVTGPGKTGSEKPEDYSPAAQPPLKEDKPVKKPPFPEPAQFQAMKAKILGIFHKEYFEAKTAEAKTALAAKLDAQGDASKGDPVERYSLWRMAAEEACDAGEVSSAIDIADKIQAEFDGDVEAIKAELLAKGAARAASTPETARNFCETAMKLAKGAVDRDDYEAALRYAKAATGTTRRVKDPQFSRELGVHERQIELLKTRYAAVEKALDTLNANANDPTANLTVGTWRCFYKGDWEKGLPCLAKGSRPELAALAKRDMSKPADARERAAVADEWWKLADKERDFKAIYRARAVFWYQQASPGLAGLEKVRVDKLLETAGQSSGGDAHSSPRNYGARGAVQKGNVALITNGAKVSGVNTWPEKMINPAATGEATSFGPTPCEFIITLDKPYQLQQIRFLIQAKTTAMYQILLSRDGQRFELLEDRSHQKQSDWQEFQFPPRPVKVIKLAAVGPPGENFCVDQFEAYCYPISGNGALDPRSGRGPR